MNRSIRIALFAAVALLGSQTALAVATAASAPWPQAISDIPPEPGVRFGVLPNGMRYQLMHNANPAHVTALRLRIAAGSLGEADDQRGLAHFIEHMAFKGSTHVPSGEMVKLLQRHGLAFGADTNAFTSQDQTTYQLDLPESDDETLDLGLMLFRETASALTLDPKAMEPERGVVLSEERQRNTPGYEAGQKALAFLMKDQPLPKRSPIGDVQVIRTATAQRLRDFYEANYRPEKTTLVAVGQFDLDQMEAKIRARFGDWRGKGPAAPDPDRGHVAKRGLEALVIAEAGLTPALSAAWTGPPDLSPDTRANEYREVLDELAVSIVNRRLETQAKGESPPFLAAGLASSDTLKSIHTTTLAVVPKGEAWTTSLTAADRVLREALKDGFTADEVQYAVTERRTVLRNLVAETASRLSPALAASALEDIESDEVFCTPAENLAIFEEAVRALTPAALNPHLRRLVAGNGPLLTLTTPTAYPDGAAGLVKAWKAAETAPLTAEAAVATKAWPYVDFGRPATVVERRELKDLGVTFVRLSNGVQLTVKPTDYAKNSVDVGFYMAGGISALPKDRTAQLWAVSTLTNGGLKTLTPLQLEETLNGRTYSATAGVTDSDWVLFGTTNRTNLLLELQLLTAFVSEPGWSHAPLERARSAMEKGLDLIRSNPAAVLGRALPALLHDQDLRYRAPDKSDVAGLTLEQIQALWTPALTREPIEVVIVGDVTVDQAVAWTAQTVGALPPRPPAPSFEAGRTVSFAAPTPEPVVLRHSGRADQAVAFIGWPTTDYYADPQEARILTLAANIMTLRLIDRFRTAEGASYAPSAGAQASPWMKGEGQVSAVVETRPEKIKSFYDAVSAISADLRAAPPTADEMDRVVKPHVEQITKARQTNGYWMSMLPGALDHPERLDNIRQTLAGYRAITPAEIQAAARKYLTDDRTWKVEVLPDATARAAPTP